ncbi:MAG: MFS transporter [Coriobacteriia bacterium]|nr:MFS transporter [Coriobacteriia bacterium]MBN2841038.1 MFS transporter [Coriobacteriia bacterium]
MRPKRSLIGRLLPAGTLDVARGFSDNARRYLLTAAMQNAGYGVIGTTFAIYLKDRGFSEAVVGDVEGALALAAAVVCLTLPPLVVSVGYRRLMIAAGIALGLSRLGQAYAPTAFVIVGLGLLYGVGDGAMQTLSTAFLSENAGHGGRTRLFTADFIVRTSSMVVGSLVGGIVPVLLRPMTGELDAYRTTIVLAGLMMVSSAVFASGIRDLPHGGAKGLAGWLTTLRGFSSWGRVTRLLVPEMLISLGAGLVMPFVALFLKHRLGASVTEVGIIQAVSSVAMAAAALATPRLAKRIGLAGTVVLTELASLPFLLSIPFAQSLPVAAVLFWLRGMLMNMSWPIYNQLSMAGLPAADKPLVAGWVRFGWSVAWLAGSSIGGRLMEQSYTVPYFFTAALYAAGATATWVLLRRVRDEDDHQSLAHS